jgi:cytochrome c oxidase assembly protein subunit 11
MSVPANDVALRNRRMMTKLLVVAGGMLAFAFALVPMYRQICDAVGISQQRAVIASTSTQVDASRDIRVELLASTAGLPWKFEALDREVTLHPGELHTVRYRVVNTLGRPVTAQAVMSTAPQRAMKYIEKQECFCFKTQTLAAGESREMPVVFRVTADAPRDLETISLSYSFMEAPEGAS